MANSIKEVLSKAGNRSSVPQQYIPKTARTEPVFDEPTLHQDGWVDQQGNNHHVSAPTLEDDIRALAVQQPRQHIGNSADMDRIEQLLSNGVTAAHDDACAAIDKVLGECRAMMARIEKLAEAKKTEIHAGGQDVARSLAAAVQELSRTVRWLEEQGPKLRNPKLDSAKLEAPASNPLEDHSHDPPPKP